MVAALRGLLVARGWLVAQPETVLVAGPRSSDWRPVAADQADPAAAPFAYAGDSAAMACARGQALEVRVYLAFGEQRARALLAEADPVAVLLEGLPGVPRRLRAVPATNAARAAGGAGAGGAGPVWERLRAGELSLDELPRGDR